MDSLFAPSIERADAHHRAEPELRRARRESRSYLVRYGRSQRRRRHIEAFIAAEYQRHFDADISEFMPTLVGLYGQFGRLDAAVGYRAAAHERLFLEIYTNDPIEEVVYRETGIRVPRDAIVEVGSLACRSGRAAMEIVTALVPALIEDGFSWVVFTGADTVRNVFRRLRLKPLPLCIANKSLLGERQAEWGTYYDHNPIVMAGRLADGIVALEPATGVQ